MTDYLDEATEAIRTLLITSRASALHVAQQLSIDQRRAIHEAAETARSTVREILGDPATPEN